jgi:hypothetical protein
MVLTLDNGQQQLLAAKVVGSDVLFDAGEPIEDVAVHKRRRVWALRTAFGRLVIGSWDPDEVLRVVVPR